MDDPEVRQALLDAEELMRLWGDIWNSKGMSKADSDDLMALGYAIQVTACQGYQHALSGVPKPEAYSLGSKVMMLAMTAAYKIGFHRGKTKERDDSTDSTLQQ